MSKNSRTTKNSRVANLLSRARQESYRGQLDKATILCNQALSLEPDNAPAIFELGLIALKSGLQGRALEYFSLADSLDPECPEYCLHMGIAHVISGNLSKGESCFRRAIKLEPENLSAHFNLGGALKDLGRLKDAEDCYLRALELKPDDQKIYASLGKLLKACGNYSGAIDNFRKALSFDPNSRQAKLLLASTMLEAGQYEEAFNLLQKFIESDPGSAEFDDYLGQAYMGTGNFHAAIDSYRNSIKKDPGFARAFNNLGYALLSVHELDAALSSFNKAIQVQPEYAKAHSNLLLALNYHPAVSQEEIFGESKRFGELHNRSPADLYPAYEYSARSKEKLRIGYLSPDFRSHSVAHFSARLLSGHDSETFEVFLYSAVTRPDRMTADLRTQSRHWRIITGLSDSRVAELIKRDRIDILVDLAGHTANNRLPVFGYRPAPIQVTWLGYPNTTGMPNMDYRLTDSVADPPGIADRLHTEKLIRLEHGFLCFQTSNKEPRVSLLPSHKNGFITFGSFNHLTKLNAEVIRVWADILRRIPNARLFLKSRSLANEHVRNKIAQSFISREISADRLIFRGMSISRSEHLSLYSEIDIGLDTFPYNGTTTTCEAMWMGVPVISLKGNRHAARVGASLMHHAGYTELVADTEREYIELACKLAVDRERLTDMRNSLRPRMRQSDLMNLPQFTLTLEDAFKRMRLNSFDF